MAKCQYGVIANACDELIEPYESKTNIQIRVFANICIFATTRMEIYESGRKNIVILGAGFGGITALITLYRLLRRRHLAGAYQLVLVNRTNHHLYTPALYEIAAVPKDEAGGTGLKAMVCIPLEEIIARLPGVRFIGEEVAALDPETHTITFSSGAVINFDYALAALGSETNFFGIDGLAEHAFPLKTFADALSLRNRVEELARREGDFKIIIAGGGATGVEFSAELVHYLCYLKERARAGKCREEITIVEAAPEILSGFSPEIVRQARRRLAALGVKIVAASPISRVSASRVILSDGRALPYQLLVWAAGVKPASVLRNFGLALDRRGGILVNEYLQARPDASAPARRATAASGRIYAIGDNASARPRRGAALPLNVPVAEAEARLAARNIAAAIGGRRERPFRPLSRYPFILAVGGKYALTDLVIAKFFGFAGWALKQLVELRYLLFILPPHRAFRMWWRAVYYSTRND